MEIDLSNEIVYKVKLPGGKTAELREPTTDDIEILSNVDKNDPKSANEAFKKFVIALGMDPADVQKIGVVSLKTLANGLMEPLQDVKK